MNGTWPASKAAPIIAILVALAGLADAVYLTIHHYTAEPVPCSIVEGCEMVLTSDYAAIGGVPIAALGALAYAAALILAALTALGKTSFWKLYGAHTALMAAITVYLIYLQAFVIGAFCQFCLLSAAVTFTLFLIFILSAVLRRRS